MQREFLVCEGAGESRVLQGRSGNLLKRDFPPGRGVRIGNREAACANMTNNRKAAARPWFFILLKLVCHSVLTLFCRQYRYLPLNELLI